MGGHGGKARSRVVAVERQELRKSGRTGYDWEAVSQNSKPQHPEEQDDVEMKWLPKRWSNLRHQMRWTLPKALTKMRLDRWSRDPTLACHR